MNEIERIIEKGIITKDFLKAETKNDFFIDENRKKLWAIELDLLHEFDGFCKKHDLKYFFVGGSLLGAVRHKGFIPWDDDLDVAMFRDDYEKMISLAFEFKEPYFLQIPGQDNGYYYSFVKFRNSNTTFVSDIFKYEKWNMGIFIDVFPLDEYKIDDLRDSYEKIKQLSIDNSTLMRKSNPNLDEDNKKRVENYSGFSPEENLRIIDELAQKYRNNGDFYIVMLITLYDCMKKIFKKEYFDEIVYLDFENIKVPTIKEYHKFLTSLYGDYMKFPPIEKRGTWHSGTVFDPNISYLEYLKNNL